MPLESVLGLRPLTRTARHSKALLEPALSKVRFQRAWEGVCEGVEKRSFLRETATKASGKKDRFTNGDGNMKRKGGAY
jgi:hypothetical protein